MLWGRMLVKVLAWAGAAGLFLMQAAVAQEKAWVQIEAQPTLTEAQDRARSYASSFPDVEGYQLRSRWYGIALGPQDRATAEARLRDLLASGRIPRDSFISDGTNFREKFWPDGSAAAPESVAQEPATDVAADTPTAELAPVAEVEPVPEPVEETPAEARRSEGLLSETERQDLQRALQWEGFYDSAIDGAFGPGTRKSMADWQTSRGYEPTGILTTAQRKVLVDTWQTEIAAFGFETVTETDAGIEITLPLGLVSFDHYEPPFVHFAEKNGSGFRVILISQPGDQSALYGLYDILQTLTIVPMSGERSRGERSFEINGQNGTVASFSKAELSQGLIKGYILVWNPAEEARARRILDQMNTSFRPIGNRALDPGMVPMSDGTRNGLLSGLELRRPKLSRSGIYLDNQGHVATAVEAIDQCARVTLDGTLDAEVLVRDAASGVAILAPKAPLSPPAVGALQIGPDRIGSEIAVAGYSYEDTLPAPVLTFGKLEDTKGLNGETGIKRLGIATLPGDAGGPVVDGTGAVLGMLVPRPADATRVLPPGVEFAATAAIIAGVMQQAGLTPVEAAALGALAPEDLTRKAMGMTVLVGCWD